jgi:hypothetical protein
MVQTGAALRQHRLNLGQRISRLQQGVEQIRLLVGPAQFRHRLPDLARIADQLSGANFLGFDAGRVQHRRFGDDAPLMQLVDRVFPLRLLGQAAPDLPAAQIPLRLEQLDELGLRLRQPHVRKVSIAILIAQGDGHIGPAGEAGRQHQAQAGVERGEVAV